MLYPARPEAAATQAGRGVERFHCTTKTWLSPYHSLSFLFLSQGCQSYRKYWTQQLRRTGRWQLSTSWQQQKRATACSSRSWRRRRKGWWWWTVKLSGWTSSLARLCWCGSSGRGLACMTVRVVSPGEVLSILVWSMSHWDSHCSRLPSLQIFLLCVIVETVKPYKDWELPGTHAEWALLLHVPYLFDSSAESFTPSYSPMSLLYANSSQHHA